MKEKNHSWVDSTRFSVPDFSRVTFQATLQKYGNIISHLILCLSFFFIYKTLENHDEAFLLLDLQGRWQFCLENLKAKKLSIRMNSDGVFLLLLLPCYFMNPANYEFCSRYNQTSLCFCKIGVAYMFMNTFARRDFTWLTCFYNVLLQK